jgi:hypothetical protein
MSRTPGWVWKMRAEVARYTIPFTFGRPPHPREEPDIHAGTCVAVETPDERFIVTARHVAEPARDAAAQSSTVQCLAGSVKLNVGDRIAFSDTSLDLATIGVNETQIRLLESQGYRIVRTDQWPPVPELHMNDPVLMAGFPGTWRLHVTWDQIVFGR